MEATQLQAVLAFYKAIKEENYSAIPAMVDDSLNYKMRPATVGGFGKPDGFSKAESIEFLLRLPSLVKNFGFQPPDFIVQENDQVAFHMLANGEAADGSPWTNEYSIFCKFVPGTARISQIVEMIDSAFALAAVQRAGITV